jgi:uncharacterized membrane protein
MSPFDLKEALLAKHAQHVVLVHFPIALFIIGVTFDLLAHWRKQLNLADAAYYNIAVAALSTLPVIATGLLAWKFQLEWQNLKGVLLLHLVLGAVASAMIWLVWYVHFQARRSPERILPFYCLPIEVLAVAVVTIAGHLGGFLSGVNGPS